MIGTYLLKICLKIKTIYLSDVNKKPITVFVDTNTRPCKTAKAAAMTKKLTLKAIKGHLINIHEPMFVTGSAHSHFVSMPLSVNETVYKPVQVRDTLQVRIALAVSPAPSAFPTRTHAAP